MNSRPNSGLSVNYDTSRNKLAISINVLVIIACFYGAYYFYNDTQTFLETAEITNGEIIRFNESRNDGEISYTAVIRYTPASGRAIEFANNTSSKNPSHAIGDVVEVIYNPDDPNSARLNSYFGLHGFTTILGILGFAGVLFFAGNQVSLNKRKELAEHLSTFGKPYETEFTGVKRVKRGKNNTYYYYITSKHVFDDITKHFKSEQLTRDPELYEDMPETIVVVADPNNLSKYAMDISFLPDDTFKPTIRIGNGHRRLQF